MPGRPAWQKPRNDRGPAENLHVRPTMKIEAVLFDLGETLLNYGRINANALFRDGARLTYDYLHRQEPGVALPNFSAYYWRHILSIKARYFWSNVVGREFDCLKLLEQKTTRGGYRLDAGQLKELAYLWYKPLGECANVEPDLHETLATLQHMGLKLGIISNTFLPGAVLDRHLAGRDLLKFFPVRVYSSETIFRKPDRRIYQRALERMGVSASSSVMVGDRVREDIRGAMRAGLQPVMKRGPYTRDRFLRNSVPAIERIAELPAVIQTLLEK
jgi:putative hydrolase of the HAD superfamily